MEKAAAESPAGAPVLPVPLAPSAGRRQTSQPRPTEGGEGRENPGPQQVGGGPPIWDRGSLISSGHTLADTPRNDIYQEPGGLAPRGGEGLHSESGSHPAHSSRPAFASEAGFPDLPGGDPPRGKRPKALFPAPRRCPGLSRRIRRDFWHDRGRDLI